MSSNNKTVITNAIVFSLHMIGAEPRSSRRILQRIICSFLMMSSLSMQFWYVASYSKNEELTDLLDGLSVILSNGGTFVKMVIIWWNHRMFFNALTIIFEDWKNLDSIGRNKRFMVDKALMSLRISNLLIVAYSMTVICYTISSLFISNDSGEGLLVSKKKLLLRMRFPFEVMFSPVYEIVIVAQFLLEYLIAFVAGMFMALLAALVLHVGSQVDIMCQELIDLPNHQQEKRLSMFKSLVAQHQKIIYLGECIRDLFIHIALVQFLSNILVICCLGFLLVNSLGTEEGPSIILKFLPFYVAANSEAFVLCYTGEYLISKSDDVRRAVCDMDWYKLNNRDMQLLLLILVRSQKELTLSAGRFVVLSVEAFATVLEASASYISLLLAMS
ncbi:odorant receptor 4-like [Lasioglossum baleicum]|uniref:odorant receptor 4-like n=1 Tax=Lasioglossum baleicum TaxID=434251 RepID=UPI003FCE4716